MTRSAEQTEEWANAASHGLACVVLAATAWPALAAPPPSPPALATPAGGGVFVATMLLMFVVSALYHAVPAGPLKLQLRRWDHALIFLFIAGSCTAFALGRDPAHAAPWPMLAGVWAVAAAGMALKLAGRLRQTLPSTLIYLAFGWLAAGAAGPALRQLNATALGLLVAGGVAYSIGCWFYLSGHRRRWRHLVWHLLVIVGSSCHLLALMHDGQ